MSATEKAATADEKTPVAVQKAPPEAENKAQEPLMYVGPTIPGIAIQNTVYEPVPEAAMEAAKGLPVFLDLFYSNHEISRCGTADQEGNRTIIQCFHKSTDTQKIKEEKQND